MYKLEPVQVINNSIQYESRERAAKLRKETYYTIMLNIQEEKTSDTRSIYYITAHLTLLPGLSSFK